MMKADRDHCEPDLAAGFDERCDEVVRAHLYEERGDDRRDEDSGSGAERLEAPDRRIGLVVIERDRDRVVQARPGDAQLGDRRDAELGPNDDDHGHDDPGQPAAPIAAAFAMRLSAGHIANGEFRVRRRAPRCINSKVAMSEPMEESTSVSA